MMSRHSRCALLVGLLLGWTPSIGAEVAATTPQVLAAPHPSSSLGPAEAARVTRLRQVSGFHFYGTSEVVARDMALAGFAVLHVDTNLFGSDGFSAPIAPAPGTWDFAELDQRVALILRAAPDARLVLRVEAGVPAWWLDAHPDALEQNHTGSNAHVPVLGEPSRFPSPAAPEYRRDAAEGLTTLLAHVAAQPWADRVEAFILTGMFSQEWYPYDAGYDAFPGRTPMMYSPHTQAAFRDWLRTRYKRDRALCRAWNQPEASLATATLPPPNAFNAHLGQPDAGAFRTLPAEQPVVDALLFRSALVVDTILTFAAQIQGSPLGDRLVGALYGYVNEFSGRPSYGHNGLGQLLDSPHIDLVLHEASYQDRLIRVGADVERGPIASVTARGKLMMIDNDQGTYHSEAMLATLCEHYRLHAPDIFAGGSMCTRPDIQAMWLRDRGAAGLDSAHDNAQVLARFLGFAHARGIAFNVFSLWNLGDQCEYSAPELLARVAALNRTVKDLPPWQPWPAQVLVVTDEASNAYTLSDASGPNPTMLDQHLRQPLRALARLGAPVDHVLLQDLRWLDLTPYRLVIFLNAFHLDDSTRAVLRQRVLQDNRTVLWLGAAGRFNQDRPNGRGKEITGLDVAHRTHPTTPGNSPQPESLRHHFAYWTSVWAANGDLPPDFYRALARDARVHLYIDDGSPCFVGPGTLTVHAAESGTRTLRFPHPVTVVPTGGGAPLLNKATEGVLHLNAGETAQLTWSPVTAPPPADTNQ